MEQLDRHAVVNSLAIPLVDVLGSTPESWPSSKTASRICFSYSSADNVAAADEHRAAWLARIREYVEYDSGFAQVSFWRFFDTIRAVARSEKLLRRALDVAVEFGQSSREYRLQNEILLAPTDELMIVDGQHRLAALSDARRHLSRRAIGLVLQTVIVRLSSCHANSVRDVLKVLENSLVEEVAKRIRLKNSRSTFDLQQSTAPSTREWVLGFLFRTGNPPPRSGPCPAAGWVFVNIITEAWREGYATVQGQEDSRSLRNTIRNRYTKARFNRGARSHASVGGVPQFAGRRHSGGHHSLAQCA
jgi:hypothetical protein